MMFSMNPNKAFEHLFDSDKINKKMKQLKEQKGRFERELKNKKIARDNLFKLMEHEGVNLAEIKNRLAINHDDIKNIESEINDTKLELEELVDLTKREEEISSFLKNNKKELRKIVKAINKLNEDDRKLLVESMLNEKVSVDFQEDNEVDGPGGATLNYNLKWNPDILQRFFDEGKITRLNKNSTDYPSRYDF